MNVGPVVPMYNTFAKPRHRVTVERGNPPAWAVDLMSRILLDAGWSKVRVERSRLVWLNGKWRSGTGHAWPGRDRITVTNRVDRPLGARETLIHECAHLLAPPRAHHNKVWKRINKRLQARYYPQYSDAPPERTIRRQPVVGPEPVELLGIPVDEWGLVAAFDELTGALDVALAEAFT